MANGIKGGKSKFAGKIIGLIILAMVLSFLSAYFLIDPINGILSLIIAGSFGFGVRRIIVKKIDSLI